MKNKNVRQNTSGKNRRMVRPGGREGMELSGAVEGRGTRLTLQTGAAVPPQVFRRLDFIATPKITNNALGYTNNRYKMNSAFDVDPLVGSTTLVGFTEWSAFYGAYRVLRASGFIDFVNNEAFPVIVYVGPSRNAGLDPGANSIGGLDWPSNALFKRHILSAKGGQDRIRLKFNFDFPVLYSKQVLADDNFAGAVTANPSILLYMVCGALTTGSDTFTTAGGVSQDVAIHLDILFYKPILLTT